MEKDFLVLPLDLTKIETHEEAVQTVLNHFDKVRILSPLTRKFENTNRPYRKNSSVNSKARLNHKALLAHHELFNRCG